VGAEGIVVLHVLVGIDGKVLQVKVYSESNANFAFGKYAVEAAKSAVFMPAIFHHQPVRCWVSFPVEFQIEED